MLSRFHLDAIENVHIAQQEFNRGGEVSYGPVTISPPEYTELSADDARALASLLVEKAGKLEQLKVSER